MSDRRQAPHTLPFSPFCVILIADIPTPCQRGCMTRAEQLRKMTPQLVADVMLYATADDGRAFAAPPGWGCPCMVSNEPPWEGWDGWPLLGERAIEPGDNRRLGFVFLSPDAPDVLRAAGQFYLWEGRIIGEAKVVS